MDRDVALVTDSTALLPVAVVRRRGIEVVPLQVVVGSDSFDEGVDPEATSRTIAQAFHDRVPVSTSRPTPAVFADVYRRAHERGAREVLSLHLSGELSGTADSARLAARGAPLPVRVVDTGQLGMAAGYAVLTAADVLDEGGSCEEAAGAALARADASTSLFYVDTLEHLRRGGRIGPAAALLGSALAVKPLLQLVDGAISTRDKVRTAGRALHRLEELAVEAAGDRRADVWVAHLANPARAGALAEALGRRLAGNLEDRTVEVGEVGAVIGAHVGPGMVAAVISPR